MNLLFFGTASAIPTAGNGYTSFLVAIGDYRILIDTGDNPVKALLECGEDPKTLDAVVLTHSHIDHLGALPSLVSALDCMKREEPLKIISAPETREVAERLLSQFPLDPSALSFSLEYKVSLTNGGFRYKGGLENEGGQERERLPASRSSLASHRKNNSGGFFLSLLPGKHAVPTSMVEILYQSPDLSRPLRFLYTSDYCHGPEVTSPAGKVDVLVHEATYPHQGLPSITSHSSARQAGQAARKSDSRLLFLCHFEAESYAEGIKSAAEEAGKEFSGNVIVPNIYQWYKIPDFP